MASPTAQRKNTGKKGNNGQNIKVFVRCRPLNTAEKNSKSFSCVDCSSREVTVKERPIDRFTKTFAFDRVFGPESKQIDVYKSVAKNCVEEVLNGFNCTIFAYGQTGTGKTFTMEGDRTPDSTSWDDDPLAGIIPRCVNHLFDELRIQKLEFTMRVSFLELYNEELFDLLSPHDDLSKLRLYEDSSRKGSCIIQGLEEVLVRSKANVYEVLEKGSHKRQTAATLMNAHSSRSHTVFTVTLHIKENTIDGDELLKTGKLHLVDLAGSENIGRSGAVDKRAREAGNINMSLLTLGRVITALVEKTPHIPYRESKLTRLLQDALGGRTKTSIIATISPAAINLEETLSTLDYAHRAKNIQNKPEVNQKLNKKELIGEYSQEIERLRLDLMAMREKSGVYLANENYQEMLQTIEAQAQEITEKINNIRGLEEGIETKTNELNTTNTKLNDLSLEMEKLKITLQETSEVLGCTQKLLHQTSVECDEQKHLVSAHVKTEDKLLNQGKALVDLADTTTNHLTRLHEKLERKKHVEKNNQEVGSDFQNSYALSVDNMKTEINSSVDQQKQVLGNMHSQLGGCVNQCQEEVSSMVNQWKAMCQNHISVFNEIHLDYKTKVNEQISATREFSECKSQECQEQKDHLKGFEMSIALPAMEKIASLISHQATMMNDFHGAMNKKLTYLNDSLENFFKNQATSVTDHESKMVNFLDAFSANTSVCMSSYESFCSSVNSKVKALEQGFNKEIQGIYQDIVASKETLPSNLKSLEETTVVAKDQVKEYTSCHKDKCASHNEVVKTLLSELQSTVEDYNFKGEDNIQHLGQERCGLESTISQQVSETNEYLESITADLNSYKTNAEEASHKSIKDNDVIVQKAVKNIEGDQEKVLEMLEKEYKRLEADLSCLKTKCQDVSTDIQKLADSQNEHLSSQKIQVVELFTQKITKDIPTGHTPIRQDYRFSRVLATTSPHDKILERYRLGSSGATRIPLPSYADDTEDELSSPLIDTSRLSSESSMLDDDTNDSKSSIFDCHSNPGSTTDLRILSSATKNNKDSVFAVPSRPVPASRENSSLSRSSSTSSIPELKDKENTSGHRGSSKKRGLKAPNSYSVKTTDNHINQEAPQTRTRRVLGTQN